MFIFLFQYTYQSINHHLLNAFFISVCMNLRRFIVERRQFHFPLALNTFDYQIIGRLILYFCIVNCFNYDFNFVFKIPSLIIHTFQLHFSLVCNVCLVFALHVSTTL
jgi:hypothetical protein